MRAALTTLATTLIFCAASAGALQFEEVFVPEGRIALAATGPVTAVAFGGESVFVAELDGNRVCEYTLAGNPRRCFDALPTHRGPMEVSALGYSPPEYPYPAGLLYVAAPGHGRIYKIDLRTQRVDADYADIPARNLAVTDYGVVVGTPVQDTRRPGVQAFHRLTDDLRKQWSFEVVGDPVLAESPWAALAVGPTGDLYGAVSGRYEIVRYSPTGEKVTSFGIPHAAYEDVVPKKALPRSEWMQLWSPIVRLDRAGDWLLVTSQVRRSGRLWNLLDVYGLDGRPAVRAVSLESEEPIASADGYLYTLRRDEPGTVLYRWRPEVPAAVPDGGIVASLPPALTPVRAASGLMGDLGWAEIRPYLEATYGVVEMRKGRPVIELHAEPLAANVPSYVEPVGESAAVAVGRIVHGKIGRHLRRGFRRGAFQGTDSATATAMGWDEVLEDPKLRTVLRGELCLELRQRGYPCP